MSLDSAEFEARSGESDVSRQGKHDLNQCHNIVSSIFCTDIADVCKISHKTFKLMSDKSHHRCKITWYLLVSLMKISLESVMWSTDLSKTVTLCW